MPIEIMTYFKGQFVLKVLLGNVKIEQTDLEMTLQYDCNIQG